MTNKEILKIAITKAADSGYIFDVYPLWPSFIYNHDFAKALWGESRQLTTKEVLDSGAKGSLSWGMRTIGWQDHLKNMVVANDPIKYLGEHL